MSREPLVRYGLPGLMFFAGVFVVVMFFDPCLNFLSNMSESLGWGIAAIIAASFLPLGWLFYNSFRFWFDLIGGDYENTDAMKLIRDNIIREDYGENLKIDIRKVTNMCKDKNENEDGGINKVFYVCKNQYFVLFDPYRFLKYYIFFYRWWKGVEEGRKKRIRHDYLESWAFTEHILHLTFFKNSSLANYTRGFAGAVNGLLAGGYAFLCGIYFMYFSSHTSDVVNLIMLIVGGIIIAFLIIPIILFWIEEVMRVKFEIAASFTSKFVIAVMICLLIYCGYYFTINLFVWYNLNYVLIYLGLLMLFLTNIYSGYISKNENDARLLLSALITTNKKEKEVDK
jgi:hypothetical protein